MGTMALLCITAAVVYAVRDALKSADCEDSDEGCEEVRAAPGPAESQPAVVLLAARQARAR